MMKAAIASFKERSEDGFTLIEMVVVLMILTTLTALAIPSMTKAVENAEHKKRIAEGEMVFTTVGLYVAEEGLDEQLDAVQLNVQLTMFSEISSPWHPLADRLGTITKKAKLRGISEASYQMSIYEVVYDVEGYRIDVVPTLYEETKVEEAIN